MKIFGSSQQIQHTTHKEAGKETRLQRTESTKVKPLSKDEIQKHKANLETHKALGKVGTNSQIMSLKSQIKSMDLDGIDPPSSLSGMETLKKFGVNVVSGVGSGLSGGLALGKELVVGKAVLGGDITKLAIQVDDSVKALKTKSSLLKQAHDRLGGIADQLAVELGSESTDIFKLEPLLLEARQLFVDSGYGKQSFVENALNALDNSLKTKEAIGSLRAAKPLLGYQIKAMENKVKNLTRFSNELKVEGSSTLVGGISETLQKASPIMNASNFIAQSAYAAKSGGNVLQVLQSGKGALMTGTAFSAVSGTVGGLQIVSEGLELYNNSKMMHSSLKRVEMSKVILAGPKERETMLKNLNKKAQALKNPSRFKKMLSSQASREKELKQIESKIADIKKVPSKEQIPVEAKRVAQQVVKRADLKFKAAKIAKNIIGITAGAVTVAVALGALATPVGWAVAGVALCTAVGCLTYSSIKGSKRQGKIDQGVKALDLSVKKIDLKEAQVEKLKKQSRAVQRAGHERQQQVLNRYGDDSPQMAELNIAQIEDSATVQNLEKQIKHISSEIDELKSLKKEVVLELLTTSPKHASEAVYDGIQKNDPSMLYIAHHILGVEQAEILPKEVAMKLFEKGMSLWPDF